MTDASSSGELGDVFFVFGFVLFFCLQSFFVVATLLFAQK